MVAVTDPFPLAALGMSILIYLVMKFRSTLARVRSFYKHTPGLAHDPTWGHMIAMGALIKDDRHFGELFTHADNCRNIGDLLLTR
jgi:hypothetical protein